MWCHSRTKKDEDLVTSTNWWYLYGRSLRWSPGTYRLGEIWLPHYHQMFEHLMLENLVYAFEHFWTETGYRFSTNSKSLYGSSWCTPCKLSTCRSTNHLTPCVVKSTALYEHGRISTKCFSNIPYDVPGINYHWNLCVCPHAWLYDVGINISNGQRYLL